MGEILVLINGTARFDDAGFAPFRAQFPTVLVPRVPLRSTLGLRMGPFQGHKAGISGTERMIQPSGRLA